MPKRIPLKKETISRRRNKARGLKPKGFITLCTDELIEDFVFHVKRIIPPSTICQLLNISERSYFNWKRRGLDYEEAVETGKPIDEEDYIFYKFMVEERKAQGHWKVKVIGRSLHPKDNVQGWIRDMTILERRDRNNWGRKDFLEVAEIDDYSPDESFL